MKNEIKELENQIAHHNIKYWNENSPEIEDTEYDKLVEKLRSLDPYNPLVNFNYNNSEMKSLEKVYTFEELCKWFKKTARNLNEAYLIEPKLDGLSSYYDGKKLVTKGTDATHIIDIIDLEDVGVNNIPLKEISSPIRGEVILNSSIDITKVLRPDGTPYKNHRNAAAGIMNSKDISDIKKQDIRLTLVSYEKVKYVVTYKAIIEKGFHFNERLWNDIVERIRKYPYPMDGIVVKVADAKHYTKLGSNSHHDFGAIAFKFKNPSAISVIKKIELSLGKNRVTPMALIKPVEINGIMIKRVTLHNWKNVLDRNICINDKVIVERAGDVIPYIASNTNTASSKHFIGIACPVCGWRLKYEEPDLICNNDDCLGRIVNNLLVSIITVGIEEIGQSTVEKIVKMYPVKNLYDFLNLSYEQIRKLENFGDASSNKLYDQIVNVRNGVEDYKILASLNILGIGTTLFKQLMQQFTVNELMEMRTAELSKIPNFGIERVGLLFGESNNKNLYIKKLLSIVKVMETKGGQSNMNTICFTGKMPEKRSYYEELAKKKGYRIASGVSKDLKVLVTTEMDRVSGKMDKARRFNVRITTLQDWLKEK